LSAYFINYVSPHLFLLFGFINDLFVRVSTKPTFALAAVSVAVTVAGFFVKSFRGVFGFMRRREEENIILQNEAANSNSHVTIPSPNNTEDNTESIHESVYFSSLENETSEITTDPLEDTIRQTDVIERKSIENRRGNANGIESPVNELEETLVCRLAKKFTWLSNRGSGVNSRTVISRTDQHQKSEASNTSEGLSSSHGKSLFR
jgi:hypothetical protein